MMKRRSFLVGGSSLALSQLLSGCNRQQRASLNLQLLKGSIPPQMLKEFRKGLKPPVQLNFAPEEQLNNLFKRLETWQQQAKNKNSQQRWSIPFIGKKTPPLADLVTLGDYWLESAIKQGLIKPLEIEDLAGWKTLPSRLQELVKRDNQGQFKMGKCGAHPTVGAPLLLPIAGTNLRNWVGCQKIGVTYGVPSCKVTFLF
jgi:putative spermidine/putrescine transport system substrate-binding protein